jgi:transcriptional regulator with XRE-family HTH domain
MATMCVVPTVQRLYDRGARRGYRVLQTLAADLREARLALGLSQCDVGVATRMPTSKISRVEHAKLPSLSFVDAAQIATAVGLDLAVKTYPGGPALRDVGQVKRVARFVAHIARPLAYRTEVPLPPRDGAPEQRSWDLTISDGQDAVGVEFEMVIHDAQAQTRCIHLKARDGGLSGFGRERRYEGKSPRTARCRSVLRWASASAHERRTSVAVGREASVDGDDPVLDQPARCRGRSSPAGHPR